MKNKLILAAILFLSSIAFSQTTVTFNYTGALQTWVVPPCVTQVTVHVDGAQGNYGAGNGYPNQNVGGNGGSVVGVLNVVAGTTLNIYVGGQGGPGSPVNGGAGGWNGGGGGNYWTPFCCYWGGGGGGASDIRVGGTALANRVVVGGGGGAGGFNYFACCNYERGGDGGPATGAFGWAGNVYAGGGAGGGGSQVAGGAAGFWAGRCAAGPGVLGVGGTACQANGAQANVGGGGGGGYYGGGAGCFGGGGGGSNYTGGLASVTSNLQGTQTGNGLITITYTGGGPALSLTTPPVTNPTCSNCNGSASVTTVGGTAPFVYSWAPTGGSNSTATGLCAGTYTCTVHDFCGDVATAVVTLTANPVLPVVNVTNIKCAGQNNGDINLVVGGGTPPYAYSWNPNVSTTNNASNLSAGTYTITITDANACTATATGTITQPPALTAVATPTGAKCNGMPDGSASVLAGGGTGAYAYSWMPGGNTNANATGLSAGVYTVTVTDANACTVSTSTVITQPAGMVVNVTGPTLICVGGTGTLIANVAGGSAPYAYSWPGLGSSSSTATITPVATQTYTVDVTDANGCTASGDVNVQFGGPPIAVTITGPSSICGGLQTNLCANATGGTGGNIFSWQPGNMTTPCVTVAPTSTTTYTVSVVDNCGRTATVTSTVHVNPLPAVNFTASLYEGCAPLCMQFYNNTTLGQGGAASYVWTFGNGDTLQSKSPTYCYSASGTYDVSLTVTSDSGCSSTLNKVNLISAFSRPNASFIYSPNPANSLDPTVQFTDKSSDKYGIQLWTWNFGDGSNSVSNSQNPIHTYQDTGKYCANLIVMDAHGCTDTANSCLVIDPVFNLYIPSAFTPNGDGKNDVFLPIGKYVKTFEMYIFDRWGMQLFHTTDITKGWNGTVAGGSIAQEDTYEYKISVTDSQNKQHSYVGQVNLLK